MASRAATLDECGKQVFVYTSCYCEENIFMLCKTLVHLQLCQSDASDLFVIFISNPNKQVPIWCQKDKKDGFCVWDYHVICVQKLLSTNGEASVWDLDTSLGLPVRFKQYVEEALKPSIIRGSMYERFFRVVPAPAFLKHFASDRRHMKAIDGGWLATPPDYDCIAGQDGAIHNLESYISMYCHDSHGASREEILDCLARENFGCVLTEDQLYSLFSSA